MLGRWEPKLVNVGEQVSELDYFATVVDDQNFSFTVHFCGNDPVVVTQ